MATGEGNAEARDIGSRAENRQDDAGMDAREAETLRSQLEEEKARADRNLTNWQRAEADLANFKRRADQERGELIRSANASLIGKLLPVLDDFGRALTAIPEEEGSTGWVEGVRLIDRKLRSLLELEGVTPIEALGQEFDPYVHEAVLREDGEGEADTVVEELQKGYKLHDRVLRPAMVKVGKRSNKTYSKE
jgi:molecular chaperone GrpE